MIIVGIYFLLGGLSRVWMMMIGIGIGIGIGRGSGEMEMGVGERCWGEWD